jgi:hypothetical protein
MPVQLFVDDSGGKGHSTTFVLAGLVSNSERWEAFAHEWTEALVREPSIHYFKMQEAVSRQGQFRRFTAPDRDAKLKLLAGVINRHAEMVIFSAIDLPAHVETWGKNLAKPLSEPYFWPFQTTIMGVCLDLWDHGWREPFDAVFDEQVIFGPRAQSWYPVLQEVVRLKEPDAAQLMPSMPVFGSDLVHLPIQAADLFAWAFRRATNEQGKIEFEWLLEHLTAC